MNHGSPFSIVCLSSQTWDAPLPTNRQQIMSRAAAQGHRVLFVETGDFLGKHLWRLVRGPNRGMLARKLFAGVEVAPGIRVRRLWNLLPYAQRSARCNRVNWRLGAAPIRREAGGLPAPVVLWIYDPRGAEAIGGFGETFAVYDCVDDYQHQTGPSARAQAFVAAQDDAAARRSRLVFVTTRSLLERHVQSNAGVHLVPNVGDFDHFRRAADRSETDERLRELPRPVLGFVGNIIENKVDFELLAHLAEAFAGGTLLLAGPAEGGARSQLEAVAAQFPNVVWLGLEPYETLPSVLAAFDVALVPYVSSPYTASVFPLKIYEYLAAGKPVVAAGVPSVAGLDPHVSLAIGHDAFVRAVEAALAEPADAAAERMALAARNTWEDRAQRLFELVEGELA